MNHLLRELAPISDEAWTALDEEARQRSKPALAARKFVDFSGPHGWQHSATNLGRAVPLASRPSEGVSVLQRRVVPVVELRADFALARSEIRAIERGATGPDLGELDKAAHEIALGENVAVFYGIEGAFQGVAQNSPYPHAELGSTARDYPSRVAEAVARLLDNGISGPYALLLGPAHYTLVSEETEHGGYPLFDHLARIVEGPVVRAPGAVGAVVASMRGGDFLFESGEDLSLGYESHDGEVVRLYLEESFSFLVATPEAAVVIGA